MRKTFKNGLALVSLAALFAFSGCGSTTAKTETTAKTTAAAKTTVAEAKTTVEAAATSGAETTELKTEISTISDAELPEDAASAEETSEEQSEKSFSLTVVLEDKSETTFEYTSTEQYLGDALLSEGVIEGTDGDYGLYVTTVNGVEANYDKDGSWWCVKIDGKDSEVSISSIEIEDGADYSLVYTK